MLRIKAEFGRNPVSATYYLSTEPTDYDGKYWEPRITNGFAISNYCIYNWIQLQ